MRSLTTFFFLLFVSAIMMMTNSAVVVSAAVTDNSVLSCETADVLPLQNITCRIYLRDELQEPTTSSTANSVFSVRVLSDISQATTFVSPVQVTKDPTVVLFTVNSNMGTRLRIDGYVSSTGLPIRNTGAVVLVLEVPATKFGDITCDSGSSLSFRTTTRCTASATGINGLPAFVTQSNFFLNEEHGDGSFQFISGNRVLQFSYTAPTFPSMTYNNFYFRLGLLSAAGSVLMETTLSLAVVYPTTAPNVLSRLRCGGDTATGTANGMEDTLNRRRCFITALDALGPVALDPNDFIVEVRRGLIDPNSNTGSADDSSSSTTNNNFLVPATEVNWTWVKGGNDGVQILTFTLAQNTFVFEGQVSVRLRDRTSGATGEPIRGSPALMDFGVAPSPASFNLIKCNRNFAVASPTGKQIRCFISVSPSVTPDPRYLRADIEVGTISCKRIANSTDLDNSGINVVSSSSMIFNEEQVGTYPAGYVIVVCYTPPVSITESRVRSDLVLSSSDIPISGGPVTITLYPGQQVNTESDTRVAALVAGIILFGSVLIVGTYFNFKHAAVKQNHIKHLVEHQKEQLEHLKLRPLFRTAAGNEINMSLTPQSSMTAGGGLLSSPLKLLNILKPAGSEMNLHDQEMKSVPSAAAAKH